MQNTVFIGFFHFNLRLTDLLRSFPWQKHGYSGFPLVIIFLHACYSRTSSRISSFRELACEASYSLKSHLSRTIQLPFFLSRLVSLYEKNYTRSPVWRSSHHIRMYMARKSIIAWFRNRLWSCHLSYTNSWSRYSSCAPKYARAMIAKWIW